MPVLRTDPTVRRRRLGMELRGHRNAAGLRTADVAGHLECTQPKISHIEAGRYKISRRDVRDMLDLYGVTDEATREALFELARQGAQKSWFHAHTDAVPNWFATFLGLEREADVEYDYEQRVIPGLLQTEDYARAVTRASMVVDPEQVEEIVALRLERQRLLTDPHQPLEYRVVLDDAALRRVVGSIAVQRAALEHVLKMTELPNISLRILPMDASYAVGTGTFTLFAFHADPAPSVVHLDQYQAAVYLEDEAQVAAYRAAFDNLLGEALGHRESRALIERTADDLAE